MKKLVVMVLTVFLLFLPLAAAEIDVSITPEYNDAMFEDTVLYELEATNTQNSPDNFEIVVHGERLEWLTVPVILLHLEAGQTKTIPLTFYVSSENPGVYDYQIDLNSYRNPSASASAGFTLNVLSGFRAHSFAVQRDGSNVNTELTLDSFDKPRDLNVLFSVTGPGGFSKNIPVSVFVDGRETISQSIPLPAPLPAGTYTVSYSVEEFTGKETFFMESISNLVVNEERVPGALYDVVTVTVTNFGNVPETYETEEPQVFGDAITGFATAPKCDQARCVFRSETIAPGTTAKIVYRVEHALPFQYAAGGLVILAAAGYGFIHFSRPKITKKYRKTKGKHSIIIEVKNPMFKKLTDVVVKDFVTPLGHVLHTEFESIKPVMKKTEEGTELVWKLGNIGPRETRLFSYKIRPLVETTLKLDRAHMKYRTKRGEASQFSGELVLG